MKIDFSDEMKTKWQKKRKKEEERRKKRRKNHQNKEKIPLAAKKCGFW
jgi:hypothetical protein